jgi:hypothetical protein
MRDSRIKVVVESSDDDDSVFDYYYLVNLLYLDIICVVTLLFLLGFC